MPERIQTMGNRAEEIASEQLQAMQERQSKPGYKTPDLPGMPPELKALNKQEAFAKGAALAAARHNVETFPSTTIEVPANKTTPPSTPKPEKQKFWSKWFGKRDSSETIQ